MKAVIFLTGALKLLQNLPNDQEQVVCQPACDAKPEQVGMTCTEMEWEQAPGGYAGQGLARLPRGQSNGSPDRKASRK